MLLRPFFSFFNSFLSALLSILLVFQPFNSFSRGVEIHDVSSPPRKLSPEEKLVTFLNTQTELSETTLEEIQEDVLSFIKEYFSENSLNSTELPYTSPEYQNLLSKYKNLGVDEETINEFFVFIKAVYIFKFEQKIKDIYSSRDFQLKFLSPLQMFEYFQNVDSFQNIYPDDLLSFFVKHVLGNESDALPGIMIEAYRLQNKLGYYSQADSISRGITDNVNAFNLLAHTLRSKIELIKEFNEKHKGAINFENFQKLLKLNREAGIEEQKEDQAKTKEDHKPFEPYIDTKEKIKNIYLTAYEFGLHTAIAVRYMHEDVISDVLQLNFGKEAGERYREKTLEKRAQAINDVRTFFLEKYEQSYFKEDYEFINKDFSHADFLLEYLFYPLDAASNLITAPLQLSQDRFAETAVKFYGHDSVREDYIQLAKDKKLVKFGRYFFIHVEAGANCAVILMTNPGKGVLNFTRKGIKNGAKVLGVTLGASAGLGVLSSLSQAYTNIDGKIRGEDGVIYELAGGYTIREFDLMQFLSHTYMSTLNNTKFLATLSVVRLGLMNRYKFTAAQAATVILVVDGVESSGDIPPIPKLYREAENPYQYLGASFAVASYLWDSGDATLALVNNTVESTKNPRSFLSPSLKPTQSGPLPVLPNPTILTDEIIEGTGTKAQLSLVTPPPLPGTTPSVQNSTNTQPVIVILVPKDGFKIPEVTTPVKTPVQRFFESLCTKIDKIFKR